MTETLAFAPELAITQWFNTPEPLTLEKPRGRIVVLHAFQMLCPGCVAHGTPQAEKLDRLLRSNDGLVVVGLHTEFEHHAAMTPVSLEAFIHEYRLTMPIGVDQAGDGTPIPLTMQRYGMRGTPTTIIIDRAGRIRHHGFGQDDDIALGLRIGALLAEPKMKDSSARDDACNAKAEALGPGTGPRLEYRIV